MKHEMIPNNERPLASQLSDDERFDNSKRFRIESEFSPAGDQPAAIKQINGNFLERLKHQVLLGVTGSGKTFTMEGFKYSMTDEARGIIPRAIEDIFRFIESCEDEEVLFYLFRSPSWSGLRTFRSTMKLLVIC